MKSASDTSSPQMLNTQVLERAKQLLVRSAKTSGVLTFNPLTMRDVQRAIDRNSKEVNNTVVQVSKELIETHTIEQVTDSEAIKSPDIHELQADIHRLDATYPRLYAADDDGNMSLPLFDHRFQRNKEDERLSDITDGMDVGTNVLLSYFLHALEIERLVVINKEQVDECQDMDTEMQEMEGKMKQLQERVEGLFKVEQERDKLQKENSQMRIELQKMSEELRGSAQSIRTPKYHELLMNFDKRLNEKKDYYETQMNNLRYSLKADFERELQTKLNDQKHYLQQVHKNEIEQLKQSNNMHRSQNMSNGFTEPHPNQYNTYSGNFYSPQMNRGSNWSPSNANSPDPVPQQPPMMWNDRPSFVENNWVPHNQSQSPYAPDLPNSPYSSIYMHSPQPFVPPPSQQQAPIPPNYASANQIPFGFAGSPAQMYQSQVSQPSVRESYMSAGPTLHFADQNKNNQSVATRPEYSSPVQMNRPEAHEYQPARPTANGMERERHVEQGSRDKGNDREMSYKPISVSSARSGNIKSLLKRLGSPGSKEFGKTFKDLGTTSKPIGISTGLAPKLLLKNNQNLSNGHNFSTTMSAMSLPRNGSRQNSEYKSKNIFSIMRNNPEISPPMPKGRTFTGSLAQQGRYFGKQTQQ